MILNNIPTGCLTEDPLGKNSNRDPPPCTDARKMRIEELAELAHMDRESKRLTETRTGALLGTVLVHGLIILWALSINASISSAIPPKAIQVLSTDGPSRSY